MADEKDEKSQLAKPVQAAIIPIPSVTLLDPSYMIGDNVEIWMSNSSGWLPGKIVGAEANDNYKVEFKDGYGFNAGESRSVNRWSVRHLTSDNKTPIETSANEKDISYKSDDTSGASGMRADIGGDRKSEPARPELPKNAISMALAEFPSITTVEKNNIKLWMRARSFGSEALIEEMASCLFSMNVHTMCVVRTLITVLRQSPQTNLSNLKGYQPISIECMNAFLKAIAMPFYVGERFMYQEREMHVTGFDYFDKSLVLADRVMPSWCSSTLVIVPTMWDSLSPVLGYCGSVGKIDTIASVPRPSDSPKKWVYMAYAALIVVALVLLGCGGGFYRFVQQLIVVHKNQMNDMNSRIEMLQNQFPLETANYLFEAAKRLQPTSG